MEITSFVVIGAIVSALVQFLKNKFGTTSPATLFIVVALSILAGSFYFFVKGTSYWEPIIAILGSAGAVYTFIIQRFEEK